MNILFVGHEENMNGASRCLIEIIDKLVDKNNIYVLTAYNKGDFFEELKKRKVTIIYFKYHRWIIVHSSTHIRWILRKSLTRLQIYSDRMNIWKLCKELKGYHLDLIHTNTSVVCIGGWLAEQLGVKHIWHLREFGKEDFNMYPVMNEHRTWKYIDTHSDVCIAISDAIKKKYASLITSDKIIRIYDGVVIPETKKRRSFNTLSINLMIAGRIGEAKGQSEAIKLMVELDKRGYKMFELFVVGSGNTDTLSKIKDYTLVEDRIHYCGFTNQLNEFRKNIDIELVCSQAEGFGRVTVEAMLMGNPVIGAATGATTELIINGFNGYTYERKNIEDFADKVIKLAFVDDYNQISSQAYKYSLTHFSIDKNICELSKLYAEILEI